MTIAEYAISTEVVSLPESAYTRARYPFSPREDTWYIKSHSDAMGFHFHDVRLKFSDIFVDTCKKILLWYLQNRSVAHASNLFNYLNHFIKKIDYQDTRFSAIEFHHVERYAAILDEGHEYYLGALSGFLAKWYRMGYPGISHEAYAFLKKKALKGNRKGWAVLTADPEEGPFTDLELQAICGGINKAYSEGAISNRAYSLVWLFLATGARPVQIATLKVRDLVVTTGEHGEPLYIVNMPRAKQRNVLMRKLFTPRKIVKDVGPVLEAWTQELREEYALKVTAYADSADLPMFPCDSYHNVPGFELHSDTGKLEYELNKIFNVVRVTSHRTGEPIVIFPRRFRYTLGTRAARNKAGVLAIAHLLDQSDTQNAWVYIKYVPEILKNLDIALAEELAPLGRAFLGEIVEESAKTKLKQNPSTVIRFPDIDPDNGSLGRCGGCGGCLAMVPVSCYVCPNFQAWADAPHEDVLQKLVEERQRVLKATGDEQMAHLNDNVILAVAQVVQACRDLREADRG